MDDTQEALDALLELEEYFYDNGYPGLGRITAQLYQALGAEGLPELD